MSTLCHCFVPLRSTSKSIAYFPLSNRSYRVLSYRREERREYCIYILAYLLVENQANYKDLVFSVAS